MTPFTIKIITYGLPTTLIIIAFVAIWTQTRIRWERVFHEDSEGNRLFKYPANQRNLAGIIIIFCVFCIMTAGAILTFEIAGHPEKSRNLAATILFQNTATAEAGR